MLCKSMDWFLYDNGLRHERVNLIFKLISSFTGGARFFNTDEAVWSLDVQFICYFIELLNYFISNEFDKINCKSYLPKTLNIPHYCKHSSATCFRPYVPFFFSEVYSKSFWNCNIFIAFIRLHSYRPIWPSNIQDWAPCYIV